MAFIFLQKNSHITIPISLAKTEWQTCSCCSEEFPRSGPEEQLSIKERITARSKAVNTSSYMRKIILLIINLQYKYWSCKHKEIRRKRLF